MARAIQDRAILTSSPTLRARGTPNTEITLSVTPEMMELLEQIASDSHQPLEVVFTRAIALYRAALNAKAEGKHIGYADSPEGFEVELVGFNGPGSE